ncbi:MAG: hypothetical protein ABJO27_23285 [Pseudoruegeria sp.]
MSLDGFLTFTGLMIATYAILSPVSRLRLRLNLYRQLVLAVLAVLLVGFFEFYFELKSVAPSSLDTIFKYVNFEQNTDGFTHQEAAFLVVVAWLMLAALLHSVARPRAIGLRTLMVLSERLHDEGRYLELVELVGPYLETIKRSTERRLFGQRLHHQILDIYLKATNPFSSFGVTTKSYIPKAFARHIRPLALLIPSRHRAYEAASSIEGMILKSDGIRHLLLRLKPGFVMKLMDRQGWEHDEFRTRYFQDSLNDNASHFYRELEANQNMDGRFAYFIDPKNVLLTGFFSVASTAAKYGIWKPIGDEAARLIRSDLDYRKLLNGPCPDDDGLQSDPVNKAIYFFDIMVTSAAKQGVADHMWLMYMSVFVRELELIHDVTDDRVDLNDEFPTLGNRLTYEATRRLRKWILIAKDLPVDSPHLSPNSLQGRDGASIPYWAARDCVVAMRCLLKSERLTESFVTGHLESYLRDLASLPREGSLSVLRIQMIEGLIHGDRNYGGEDLRANISRFVGGVDHVVIYEVPDFQELLERDD